MESVSYFNMWTVVGVLFWFSFFEIFVMSVSSDYQGKHSFHSKNDNYNITNEVLIIILLGE